MLSTVEGTGTGRSTVRMTKFRVLEQFLGSLNLSIFQLGRRGASQMMQPEVVEKPPAVEEPPVDVAGPKTRGASRRRQVEPAAGGGSGAGSGMKKAKT